ncbi:MAG: pyruvate kinase alpha/beta domain-containing protein [Pseudomonadales bacterium]
MAVPTRSGRTARLVSAERPAAPVVALVDDEAIGRRLALSWGLVPEVLAVDTGVQIRDAARDALKRLGLAQPGDSVLLVWDAAPDSEKLEPTVSILRA